MITKLDAILSLVPGAEFSIVDQEITWINPSIAPVTEEEIQNEVARLEADYVNKEYQRLRSTEYPSIVDQLDTLYHGGFDAWKATIDAVKNKYPKP